MATISCGVVHRPPPQEVREKTGRPRYRTPRNAPRATTCEMGGERFLARGVQKGPVKVEIRSDLAPHDRARLPTLHERTAWSEVLWASFHQDSDEGP